MIVDFNTKGKGKTVDILCTNKSGTKRKEKLFHIERLFCE